MPNMTFEELVGKLDGFVTDATDANYMELLSEIGSTWNSTPPADETNWQSKYEDMQTKYNTLRGQYISRFNSGAPSEPEDATPNTSRGFKSIEELLADPAWRDTTKKTFR